MRRSKVEPVGKTVRFRDVTVDFDNFRLVRDGVVVPTQPQVFDVLSDSGGGRAIWGRHG